MRTIAATVTEYIRTKPYLSSAFSDKIINLTSLARKIHPDIELLMRKPVNQGAIIMSLKTVRYHRLCCYKNYKDFTKILEI